MPKNRYPDKEVDRRPQFYLQWPRCDAGWSQLEIESVRKLLKYRLSTENESQNEEKGYSCELISATRRVSGYFSKRESGNETRKKGIPRKESGYPEETIAMIIACVIQDGEEEVKCPICEE